MIPDFSQRIAQPMHAMAFFKVQVRGCEDCLSHSEPTHGKRMVQISRGEVVRRSGEVISDHIRTMGLSKISSWHRVLNCAKSAHFLSDFARHTTVWLILCENGRLPVLVVNSLLSF